MQPEQVSQVNFDPFDVTKVWPRDQFPMQEVGEVELNRNPEDYHRDVEQAAFSPGSLVPGIELSPDTLLQWRAFFYRDAQMHRLQSANIHQIPVNCPCTFHPQSIILFALSLVLSKFHSTDNYWGSMRIDGDVAQKPTYVSLRQMRVRGCKLTYSFPTAISRRIPLLPLRRSLVNLSLRRPGKRLRTSFRGTRIGSMKARGASMIKSENCTLASCRPSSEKTCTRTRLSFSE